jgi:malate dehydrogenase (oxaloacetate-decarboxylating)
MPLMTEEGVFAETAAAVAEEAVREGVARRELAFDEVLMRAKADIAEAQKALALLVQNGLIEEPPQDMLRECLEATIADVEGRYA